MAEVTSIAWTDHTFSPWWGCTKIESPNPEGSACDNCYAATQANRYGFEVWGKDADRRSLSDDHWRKPLRWNRLAGEDGRPHLVFCASMGDVFEHRVPDDLGPLRERLWDLIDQTPNLIWQLLTKRPEWVPSMVPRPWMRGAWPERVWMGVTVESEPFARIRMPRLAKIPAPITFLSMEPLLGDVDLTRYPDVRWIIVGGESGSPRRDLDLDAARRLRDYSAARGIPFFFKQTSAFKSGTPGPEDLMVREFPELAF